MATMNTRFIHIMIVMLLLSLTAHEAHSAVIHDVETCEVCVQAQSNDDSTTGQQPQYLLFDDALIKNRVHQTVSNPVEQTAVDFIRGPPIFS